ncbi:MAG: hypothetical protein WC966_11545 [Bradymonadales bacterium]
MSSRVYAGRTAITLDVSARAKRPRGGALDSVDALKKASLLQEAENPFQKTRNIETFARTKNLNVFFQNGTVLKKTSRFVEKQNNKMRIKLGM